MMKKPLMVSALAALLTLPAGLVMAADQEVTQDKDQLRQQTLDGPLMTEQEHNEFREKMRTATSSEERRQIQMQRHEQMKERAKARHATMRDQPPGMGAGQGQKQ